MKSSLINSEVSSSTVLLVLKIQQVMTIEQHIVIEHTPLFLAHHSLHKISITLLTEDFEIDKLYQYFNIALSEVLTHASKKRRLEFFAGRLSAKFALAPFGLEDAQIPKGAKGEPLWPNNICGSISHTSTKHSSTAVAYVQKAKAKFQGVGIDIEAKKNNAYFKNETLLPLAFLNDQEQAHLLEGKEPYSYLIIFSAKESIIKAVYNKFSIFLSFFDIKYIRMKDNFVEFTVPALDQHIYSVNVKVSFYFTQNNVITICTEIPTLII